MSFDCYGTLVDWKKGVLDILQPFFAQHDADTGREELFKLFLQEDRKLTGGDYLSYGEILASITGGMASELGVPLRPSERYVLSDNFSQWVPFPDTVESLRILKQNFRLAIISNVDDALFRITNKMLDIEFDFIVTAEQLGSYKPSLENFHSALERFRIGKEQVLHVAQSIYHDIVPTNRLGWMNVWVNRYNEAERTVPEEFPGLEVPDLSSLVRIFRMEQYKGSSDLLNN